MSGCPYNFQIVSLSKIILSGRRFIVAQIGAREHYAVSRSLQRKGVLASMVTDFWVSPSSWIHLITGARRLHGRFHGDLASASIFAHNVRMLCFEMRQRLRKRSGWAVNMARNELFQKLALSRLGKLANQYDEIVIFSYSYAAKNLFKLAKRQKWKTILDQIDPGPEEERIVSAEHERYPDLGSRWQPAPASYWQSWRQEVDLADIIVVNSEWSRQCLVKEGINDDKIEIIPLVYQSSEVAKKAVATSQENISGQGKGYEVLFLGQINLRKGIGRLLDAMRLLKDENVKLTLAGPCEINPESWADLPNVNWLGPVPRDEVGQLYEQSDVFILPTLSDGYAITQLEALARGVPVIASARCGSAVDHGVNGWVLEDLEPDSVAAAILRARDENLKPVCSNSNFTLDDLGQRLMELAQ